VPRKKTQGKRWPQKTEFIQLCSQQVTCEKSEKKQKKRSEGGKARTHWRKKLTFVGAREGTDKNVARRRERKKRLLAVLRYRNGKVQRKKDPSEWGATRGLDAKCLLLALLPGNGGPPTMLKKKEEE